MLVKQKLAFSQKCKNIFTNQEIISDTTFKAWPFSSDFNFACKDGWVTAATCKYYCLLVVNPTITNCCKELHLKFCKVLQNLAFCGSSQWLFKVKITCKRLNFIGNENQIRLYISCNFCYTSFLLKSIFSLFVDIQLKLLNSLCWVYPRLMFFTAYHHYIMYT